MIQNRPAKEKGALLVLVLVFGTIFFLIVVAFMGFVVTQARQQTQTVEKEQALAVAEAGLNYAKWYLAHYPGDTTFGTTSVPVVMPYEDSESGFIGDFSLTVASTSFCGKVASIDIYSTGYTYNSPQLQRTIYGRYAQPTVAEFAYIINSNVWAGADRIITGPYHSNGVIRMDGTNNSTVTSGQENWTCDSSVMPCTPGANGSTVNGVYGDGPNYSLWNFPSTPINFTGLVLDLAQMKVKAQTGGGVYIGDSNRAGYRIRFRSNGTFDLYLVRSKENEPNGNAYGYHMNKIKNAQFQGNYTIPASCPLIFVEDNLWIDGVINGKVTVAAADLDTTGVNPTVVLQDNITYNATSSGLLAIAELDMLVGFDVPTDMTLNGIFMAQTGKFGRNHYNPDDIPNAWDQYVLRNSLTINGTVVSNGRVGTKWTCNGVYCSGFNTRVNSYDRDLVNDPPPLTPATSDDYKFIEWREEI